MIDREIRPGRLCLIINSAREGNNGKVVEVIRKLNKNECVPELGFLYLVDKSIETWLVKGSSLLQTFSSGESVVSEFAVYNSRYLLPIDDFKEDTVEHKEEEFSERERSKDYCS